MSAMRSASAQTNPPLVSPDVRFLLGRITNGYDAPTFARAQALGAQAFLEEQLHPEAIPDPRGGLAVSMFPTITRSSQDNYVNDYLQGRAEMLRTELRCATILRAAWSARQLHERMVEFWSDHFNIDHTDSMNAVLKTQDDREVIRRNALGNFRQMLLASAASSSMGFYLGNYRNTAAQPNENYGREIMELHTLGVGNYSEDDVKAVSRCFTGWGFKEVTTGEFGMFRFRPWLHDDSAHLVLGTTIPAGGGQAQGEYVVNMLAMRPTTAKFLAKKLCRFFLCYEPPQAVVDAVASAYMASGGEIKPMLRVIFAPSSIAQVAPQALPKYKRPFHLVTSILRALDVQITQPEALTLQLQRLGHDPFRWPTPDGYPDRLDAWAPGEQTRWAFTTDLFTNAIPGLSFDPASIFAGVPKHQLAATVNRRLTGDALSHRDVMVLQLYVDSFPSITDALLREVMVLAASSPSFQIY
jgi:uncharacterized protein (DUF1800 family)